VNDPSIGGEPLDTVLVLPRGQIKAGRDTKLFLFLMVKDQTGYFSVNIGSGSMKNGDIAIEAGQGGLGTEEAMRRIAVPLSQGDLKLTFSVAEVFSRPNAPCRLAPARE
jgi:hypothetical protein